MTFDDPDLDDEYYAYNVIRNVDFPGHVGRKPETRPDHADYKGVQFEPGMKAKGVTVVKTQNSMIGSKKARKNDKHFKEQYAYRKPKVITGIPAKPAKPATIRHNKNEAQEEAWNTYNDIKDRMTADGKPVPHISKKDFFVTEAKIQTVPRQVMDMCFVIQEQSA